MNMGESTAVPMVPETDNRKDVLLTINGEDIVIIIIAAAREVRLSLRLLNMPAAQTNITIIRLLTTEGVKPAVMAKSNDTAVTDMNCPHFGRRSAIARAAAIPAATDICIPETAATWPIPARYSRFSVLSDIFHLLLPKSIPISSSPSSEGTYFLIVSETLCLKSSRVR